MARKQKHEDHQNHEAWAIPYGDLITLLLAFFVVMYSISSINEGKYRVLSDALSQAFGGPPKSLQPVQIGNVRPRSNESDPKMINIMDSRSIDEIGTTRRELNEAPAKSTPSEERARAELQRMADQVAEAMRELIDRELIVVRRTDLWLEIEIRTDILFPSGVARLADSAVPVLQRLAEILKPFPNDIRIEGHTDNVPISTASFPSNWELSLARAAGVVHLFMNQGVDGRRMTVAGMGEYQPVESNDTAAGRNRNRRVLIVVMGSNLEPPVARDVEPNSLPDSVAPRPALAPLPAPQAAARDGTVYVAPGTLARLKGG